jgi:hypothetical protein
MQNIDIINLNDTVDKIQETTNKTKNEIGFFLKRLESLSAQQVSTRTALNELIKKQQDLIIDSSKYLEITAFDKFLLGLQKEKENTDNNFASVNKLLTEMAEALKSKSGAEDMKLFEQLMNNKLEELKLYTLRKLADKIEMQKQYLVDNAEEKKKQMQQLWKYRSQTLPNYRHPLQVKIEEEKIRKINEEEDEQKKKEYNQLEKINYKPPSVKINKRLKTIREKRINQSNKDMVLETELNNKMRLNKFRISPINTTRNKSIKDEQTSILNSNNYIDLNEVKKALVNKNKNKAKLKPIQILHPKPDKPIDYLKELKEKRNLSTEIEKKKVDNFDDLFTGDKGNENILESLEMAKIRTDSIDKQVERKKEIMNASGGYLKNPYMASEIGDLLVESIQAKLKIMNKLNGE